MVGWFMWGKMRESARRLWGCSGLPWALWSDKLRSRARLSEELFTHRRDVAQI